MMLATQQLQLVLAAGLAVGRKFFADEIPVERMTMADDVTVAFAVAMDVIQLEALGRTALHAARPVVSEDGLEARTDASATVPGGARFRVVAYRSSVALEGAPVGDSPLIRGGGLAAAAAVDSVAPPAGHVAVAVRAGAGGHLFPPAASLSR
jgi:hypothetical protein